jgi:hypothetical protein
MGHFNDLPFTCSIKLLIGLSWKGREASLHKWAIATCYQQFNQTLSRLLEMFLHVT